MSSKNQVKIYSFEGKPISFEAKEGDKFVSATQMAKAFDRRLQDFFRTNPTINYLQALHRHIEGTDAVQPKVRSRPSIEELANAFPHLIKVIRGGEPDLQGTWIHERLALKLAAWLSPEFELWVYDTILNIMKTESIILTGTEKTTYEWLLTKFANNVDEMRILLNHFPGQLPENIRLSDNEDQDE